eukprot:TRINITY_DN18119_c0_g1_i1.p1 TRINITY_DN18119_c0_g1~~TRINITY_DN18119_c0_g1_i1.p1  ORF type:complete len:693 (+),score=160.07 TRINITY_DN18119_c0_g1_i1:108-2186(+)
MPPPTRTFEVGEMVFCRERVNKVVKEMAAWNRYELEDKDGERVWKDVRSLQMMPKVAIAWDERMSRHAERMLQNEDAEAILEAPERHDRCDAIWAKLTAERLTCKCERLSFEPASKADICLFHTTAHYDRVMARDEACLRDEENLAKTLITEGSPLAARLAVGCVIAVMREVMTGAAPCGLAVVRPPGHHALQDASMGFCLFNNVVVAAQVAQRDFACPRVLILDWDVHHGNGIQDAFYSDPSVLYISLHVIGKVRGRFYPGTGGLNEIGDGEGKGYNVNIGWRQTGVGDDAYKAAFEYIVMPIAHEFNPDLVFISAGFDAGAGDPLGECRVSPDGFRYMTRKLLNLADGRCVVALEGGYSLDTISACSCAVLSTLQTDGLFATKLTPPSSSSTPASPTTPASPQRRRGYAGSVGSSAAPKSPASPASALRRKAGYATYPGGETVEESDTRAVPSPLAARMSAFATAEPAAPSATVASPVSPLRSNTTRRFGTKGRLNLNMSHVCGASAEEALSLSITSPDSPASPGLGRSWGRDSSPCGWEGVSPPSTPAPKKYTAFPPQPEYSLSDCSASCFAVLVDTARMLAPYWPCLEDVIPRLEQAEEEVRQKEAFEAAMEARRRREEAAAEEEAALEAAAAAAAAEETDAAAGAASASDDEAAEAAFLAGLDGDAADEEAFLNSVCREASLAKKES